MNPIRNISGYPMCEDYEVLFELAHIHAVVCELDYRGHFDHPDEPPCRDIAHTLFREDWYEISARGIAYVSAFSKETFISSCKRYHVKFILPGIEPNYFKAKMREIRTFIDANGGDQCRATTEQKG